MKKEQATQIIKDAIKLSVRDAKNMTNAMRHFGTIYGWTNENIAVNFVELCLKRAEEWKKNREYLLRDASEAGNVALYIDNAAADDIEKHINGGEYIAVSAHNE